MTGHHRVAGTLLVVRPAAVLAVAAAGGLAGALALFCPAQPAAAQTSALVTISNISFSPASVQVFMGPGEPGYPQPHAHVGFINNDPVVHNVTFDGGVVAPSGNINPNGFFDAVLSSTGTFGYQCTIHPEMRGSVTVGPMAATTTTTTTAPTSTTSEPVATTLATTVPGSTAPTTRPATSTTRPGATTTTRAPGATTTTTATASTTTVASTPGATEATSTSSSSSSSSSTTSTTAVDGSEVAASRPQDDDGGSGSPVLVLLLVAGAGALAFLGRTAWLRRRPGPPPPEI